MNLSFESPSVIIKAGIAKPIMHPTGIERPPKAVATPLSLSPNQVVANLLAVFIKKTCPNAAKIDPKVMI